MHETQKNNQIQQSAIHEQGYASKFDIEFIHWIYIQYRCIIFLDTISIKYIFDIFMTFWVYIALA